MLGFKPKKPSKKKEIPEKIITEEPVDDLFVEPAPIPTPIDLPLDGVVPDPSDVDEPDPIEVAAPMLDFSAPSSGNDAEDGEQESTSLSDLFSGTEEESESSLGPIMDMVQQVTIDEVMEDLIEIKEMLRGRIDEQ